MKILVTGGAGYIGTHTCVELLNNNYEIVVLDNFSNSSPKALKNVEKITGKKVKFYEGNMLDKLLLEDIFKNEQIDAVIDFAAYKSVGESVSKPIEYYINNVSSVLNLITVMKEFNCKRLVFSSSATVYGDPEVVPITEQANTGGTTNPYGTSKLYVEGILQDLYKSDNNWNIVILRYFNPIGAHESGLIGEEPNGIPANIMPFMVKVANKEIDHLNVFGDDYDTKDGTGVRDYIHVVDLARGHIKALEKSVKENGGLFIYNLGTGIGYSVLDLITTFEKVNGVNIPYQITERRPGDIAECYAETSFAEQEIGFKTTKTIEDMCKDAYNFVIKSTQD